MITSEMLNECNLRKHLLANQQQEKPNPIMRDPATCRGFLNLEEAMDEINKEGRISFWSNDIAADHIKDPVCFFTGISYNHAILEQFGIRSGIMTVPCRVTARESLPSGIVSTPQDILTIFGRTCRHINSEEELLKYLNNFTDANYA